MQRILAVWMDSPSDVQPFIAMASPVIMQHGGAVLGKVPVLRRGDIS
jgi:hypothetical protein